MAKLVLDFEVVYVFFVIGFCSHVKDYLLLCFFFHNLVFVFACEEIYLLNVYVDDHSHSFFVFVVLVIVLIFSLFNN